MENFREREKCSKFMELNILRNHLQVELHHAEKWIERAVETIHEIQEIILDIRDKENG